MFCEGLIRSYMPKITTIEKSRDIPVLFHQKGSWVKSSNLAKSIINFQIQTSLPSLNGWLWARTMIKHRKYWPIPRCYLSNANGSVDKNVFLHCGNGPYFLNAAQIEHLIRTGSCYRKSVNFRRCRILIMVTAALPKQNIAIVKKAYRRYLPVLKIG